MVKQQISNLRSRVRFSHPAPLYKFIMQLEKWFATPVWYDYTVFNFDSVAAKCREIAKTHANRSLSNVGGWQSNDFDLYRYDELKPVADIIRQKIIEFSSFISPRARLDFDNSWLNINYKGNYNSKHYHPLSVFSGVIYISANDDSGNIVLYNDSPMVHYQDIFNNDSDLFFKEVTYKPKNGMILMFPAWVAHSVTPNMSDEPRISIAFNIKQI